MQVTPVPHKGGTPASSAKVIDEELSLNKKLAAEARDTTAAGK